MKKFIIIITLFFCFKQVAFSQDFYFGLKTGWTKETYTLTAHYGLVKLFMEPLSPTAMFHFKTIFNNRMELGTGLGFYNYGFQIGTKTFLVYKCNYTFGWNANNPIYRSFTIPIALGYSFPVIGGLSVKISSGINFDLYFDYNIRSTSFYPFYHMGEDGNLIEEPITYPYAESFYYGNSARFNILLSNQISIEYCTKKNFCISVFTAYHTGLREVWNGKCFIHFDEIETLYVALFTRGSYWHFGLELGYKLNRKDKKKE